MTTQANDRQDEQFVARLTAEIRAEMARQRKTAADLAVATGMTPHTAGRRLNGTVPFNVVELAQVATWLGIGVVDLVGRATSRRVAA